MRASLAAPAALLVLLGAAVLGVNVVTVPAAEAAPADWTRPNPLATQPFYVDPESVVQQAIGDHPSSAPELSVIAGTAQARWFAADWSPTRTVRRDVDRYVTAATTVQATPVLTLFSIPYRDCGNASAGGLGSAARYRAWIKEVARGIGDRPAVVVLEPDAVPLTECLGAALQQERQEMLTDAINRLSASTKTAVYLDGGHSGWLSPTELAARLEAAGVSKARGFSLNVSNFQTTSDQTDYGEAVSKLLGGAHYVVDTSRNGAGPAAYDSMSWCNPAGRAIGVQPTTTTAGAHADAYLWMKRPGESDGDCARSEPAAGQWFNDYAVDLVRRAQH